MKYATRVMIILIALPFVFGAAQVAACNFRERRLQAGYESIEIGDTRSKVTERMGSGDIHACASGDQQGLAGCQQLEYYSFLNRWIVTVDSNDKVIFKVHNEGSY